LEQPPPSRRRAGSATLLWTEVSTGLCLSPDDRGKVLNPEDAGTCPLISQEHQHDQATVKDLLIGACEIGRKEGGILATIREDKELPSFPRPRPLPGIYGWRELLVERSGQDAHRGILTTSKPMGDFPLSALATTGGAFLQLTFRIESDLTNQELPLGLLGAAAPEEFTRLS